jgi:predicted CoA-binding protein
MRFLLEHGYRVFPVNPGVAGTQLLGQTVYASLADLPQRVDMLDVFRQATFLEQIVDDAVTHDIGVLWTQLGVVDHSAAQRAQEAGIQVVMDRCPAIEWPRLRAAGLL